MSLLDDAIWWHVYPLGALGAPIRDSREHEVVHRLPRLDAWLDHAVKLGCSGILLAPIFASESHGYDTLDHFAIDPRLGDAADFEHFMTQCRARGLNVMLDGVFNHVSARHPRAFELARRTDSGEVEVWEGHSDLVNLDHSKEAVADLVTEVMCHWLRAGIAGWRLDVAYAVPASFWRNVISRVRAEFPDALFLGEVIHGDYAQIVADSAMDTLTQYEMWKSVWSSIKDRNFWELAWNLERHGEFCEAFVPQTFIGNHDVTRIASAVGRDGAALAAVILMTLPGMPSIYYGDERAFTGDKGEGLGADDALRPELPSDPSELAADGEPMQRLYQELIGVRRRNPWIARGRVRVLGKDLEWIDYAVADSDGERVLSVSLDLRSGVSARIDDASGAEIFRWSGV
ncbi:MAG: alpha-amylase family protein [Actinomycetaceae bacterium]|nr:alpha-amylase family protein [Actinomycetaceae bacterium]